MDSIKVDSENNNKSFSITTRNHKKLNKDVKLKVYNRNYYMNNKFDYKGKYIDYYKNNKIKIKLAQQAKKARVPSEYNKIREEVVIKFD